MSSLILDNPEAVGAWVAHKTGQLDGWGPFQAFGVEIDGQVVAGVVINNYNGANATCHIAIERRSRLLPDLFRIVCAYAFGQCGLKRLTGMVPTNEPHIIKFDKHLGFEEEFVMKHGAPGADMQILVMWADKCPWYTPEE